MNNSSVPAGQPAAGPVIRRVAAGRIGAWLAAGWGDLVANPIPSLAYGLLFGIGGDLILLASLGRPHLFTAALSGFFLLAPLLAVGLYELSRQHAAGTRPTFIDTLAAFRGNGRSIALFALVLGTITLIWERASSIGFGLLGGEVAFIATTLIVIDVTLAALFWTWGAGEDILARLVRKTLFVGVFAYLISNWNALARIVFESFSGLGLLASGTGFTAADLLRPGRIAQTGLDAARPLLESVSDLMGWVSFFENFIQIVCLLFAWALVLLAFFILAIQLFVTLIEERDHVLLRCTATGLALERFRRTHNGAYPDSLQALVPGFMPAVPIDPFDGRPLRYVRRATGYVVYSIGADRADNGGTIPVAGGPGDGPDISFVVER